MTSAQESLRQNKAWIAYLDDIRENTNRIRTKDSLQESLKCGISPVAHRTRPKALGKDQLRSATAGELHFGSTTPEKQISTFDTASLRNALEGSDDLKSESSSAASLEDSPLAGRAKVGDAR
ncbi:hypothetical protein AJ80_06994 [Polytolypa hystricis UAMH7299]|uniref:Uncharacterized protein n=1 Tax=Polytolypa hystricis (strain UAMH7299) TaxID=1447883 RepID=A0A2B7XSJ0_POLH7|nr:hypothetical protein AJ80_06994 [Polytolypa hystricis UAMH7299]